MHHVQLHPLHVLTLTLRGPGITVSLVLCFIMPTHKILRGTHVVKPNICIILNRRSAREILGKEYESFPASDRLPPVSKLGDFPLTRSLMELVPGSAIRIGCVRQESFGRMHVALEDVRETLRSVTLLAIDKETRRHVV
jgi:hypothetical protein